MTKTVKPERTIAASSSKAGGRTLGGYFLLATGILACPCHLPLLLIFLGGTVLGAFLRENLLILVPALFIYFFVAIIWGLKLLNKGGTQG
ncbi:MAG: mercury resistance protein [Nitrospinota bacterium]